jgi:hypothetical protein
MTAAPEYRTEIDTDESLAPTLRAVHEIWLRESDRFLSPVATEEAPFWTRWTRAISVRPVHGAVSPGMCSPG